MLNIGSVRLFQTSLTRWRYNSCTWRFYFFLPFQVVEGRIDFCLRKEWLSKIYTGQKLRQTPVLYWLIWKLPHITIFTGSLKVPMDIWSISGVTKSSSFGAETVLNKVDSYLRNALTIKYNKKIKFVNRIIKIELFCANFLISFKIYTH